MNWRTVPAVLDATAEKLNPWLVLMAVGLAIIDAMVMLANAHPAPVRASDQPAPLAAAAIAGQGPATPASSPTN